MVLACCLCKPVFNHSDGGGAFRRLLGTQKTRKTGSVPRSQLWSFESHPFCHVAYRLLMPWNVMLHRAAHMLRACSLPLSPWKGCTLWSFLHALTPDL